MLLKMLLSAAVFFIAAAGLVLFGNQGNSIEELSSENIRNDWDGEKTFDDESYYFYLDEEEIKYYIRKGISSLTGVEEYKLTETGNTLRSDDVAFAYAELPSLTVMEKAGSIYYHADRFPEVEEIKEELRDDYIPVHVRYEDNRAYVYEAFIKQGEEKVFPAGRKIAGEGSMESLFFKVEDLQLDEEAELIIEDTVNEDAGMKFSMKLSEMPH